MNTNAKVIFYHHVQTFQNFMIMEKIGSIFVFSREKDIRMVNLLSRDLKSFFKNWRPVLYTPLNLIIELFEAFFFGGERTFLKLEIVLRGEKYSLTNT